MFWEYLTGLAVFGFICAFVSLNGAAIGGAVLLLCLCIWHWSRYP